MNEPNWKHYTIGFYFIFDLSKVLLIRKAKPQWQMGRLNGIGGSFEQEDKNDCVKCMKREFEEETLVTKLFEGKEMSLTQHEQELKFKYNQGVNWKKFAEGEITVHQGDCFLHYMVTKGPYFEPIGFCNELCEWVDPNKLPIDVVPNLHWLIPMAKLSFEKPWWSEIATFRTSI